MQTVIYEDIIKLQGRSGVINLPKKARADLFDDSNLARIMRIGNKLIIEPVRVLPYSVRSYTDGEIDEFFKLDDEETKKLKNQGIV